MPAYSPQVQSQITVVTGGIGGAKLVAGLSGIIAPGHLKIIGNVGDDDQFHGLWVSPDIDTLVYTLSGIVDREKGWGLSDDSFNALDWLGALGEETWMTLGDKDLAIHIYRTMRRNQGHEPAVIASDIAVSLGVKNKIILPTNDLLQTRIKTAMGRLSMEEYFVRERCKPEVDDVEFFGSESARANPEALEAIYEADVLIYAPSNPIASIGPTLSIPAIRSALESTEAYRVAMSPIIGGKAIKGPSCEMLKACGFSADLRGITECYKGLMDAFVIDSGDEKEQTELSRSGIDILTQNILMSEQKSRAIVAEELLKNIFPAENSSKVSSSEAMKSGRYATY